ncbi:protein I'm not dead yet-like [Schistocerca americana]|uniref:protein I'm not dead yet-like n=1 Tax=Schistocerca americana TaxID=7009 RepID=UPI001F4FFF36|nr:protein I'm not dead yet-like [Schistocerca americana]
MKFPVRGLVARWRSLVLLLCPLVLLPLAVSSYSESRCGFVVLVMAVYWMTEVLPLPITSLLPVVLYPMLGILSSNDVCIQYLKETNMMFVGGLIVAIAMEHCNLHKRIALKTILIIGTSPRRLTLGFMLTTMVLSMWISNTATTAMMTPIVQAVLEELKAHEDVEARRTSQVPAIADSEEASGVYDPETRRKSTVLKSDLDKLKPPDKETICYFLGIAYASNLGGTGTLTGTGTNLTFKGIFHSLFPEAEGINFASWMIFCVPLMLLSVTAAWMWLNVLYMGLFRKQTDNGKKKGEEHAKAVRQVIHQSYSELGPMTYHEGSVLFLFVAIVLLWFFREPEFIPGWAKYISNVEIEDATPAMLIVFLLFCLPANLNFLKLNKSGDASPALLHWKAVHEKVPWGLVLLLGGGFAMAAGTKASGLNQLLGETLVALEVLPREVILIIVCTATTFLTEVSSNTAIANIVTPVLAEMAKAMEIHPLYFMMPAVLCCSFAFMLPVATPPNAIVMAASNMRSSDMMKAGLGMNVICIILVSILFPTFGSAVYGLDTFPDWARGTNITTGV